VSALGLEALDENADCETFRVMRISYATDLWLGELARKRTTT
jgi:hypothetical protein